MSTGAARPVTDDQIAAKEWNRRAIPFHPVLFALAPIIFVFAHNGVKTPIYPGDLLLPVALSLAVTALLWTSLGLLFRGATRSAPIVSLFLLLFFSYGHVVGALEPKGQTWTNLLRISWALLMAGGTWLAVRFQRPSARGSQFGIAVSLNSIAAAILAVNLVTGARAFTHRPPRIERGHRPVAAATAPEYPDIYYIITDAYTRSDVLQTHFHTDNSDFLGELSRLGFVIIDQASSNYAQTYLSLASSLNFTYLDSVAETMGPESNDRSPLFDMIQNSRLVDFLRRRGYTIVSFASGFTGTDLAGADVHFAPRWSPSEFHNAIMNTTLLRDVFPLVGMSPNDAHRNRILYTIRSLPDAGHGRHPVFVWAHVVCPHPPFVFDARGAKPPAPASFSAGQARTWLTQVDLATDYAWYDKYYGPQVTYLNTLLADAVRHILARSPRPPIIVIQADHGTALPATWSEWRRDRLPVQHAIFLALHLPPPPRRSRPPVRLYGSISPVNTFRIILTRYFDTTLALLPDHSYYSSAPNPYLLYDINQPESCPGPGRPDQ